MDPRWPTLAPLHSATPTFVQHRTMHPSPREISILHSTPSTLQSVILGSAIQEDAVREHPLNYIWSPLFLSLQIPEVQDSLGMSTLQLGGVTVSMGRQTHTSSS